MINNFIDFINEEVSKNDPIPEITRMRKGLGIILLGTPGAGKSSFANNFILPRNSNFKKFSTDDVSLLYTKDPSQYHKGASELNLQKLERYMETGNNFVYDTTGTREKNIREVVERGHRLGYKIVFCLVLVDLATTKKQNLERGKAGGHQVPDDFIEYVYDKQFKNIRRYSEELKPENFYIIHNKNKKYKFLKFKDGKIWKRKVDTYVPVTNINKPHTSLPGSNQFED
jgi:predicted ABC-type ATPase